MSFIIELLLNAAVLFFLAYIMPTVSIRSYGTAVAVALVVGILNATIGVLIRFPLNLVTFWLLSFIVRVVVTALMIKIADKLFRGFDVRGFKPALIIALVMAIVGTLFSSI